MTTRFKLRLLRLWKGVLLLTIGTSYVLYILWMLLYVGWREALFAALAVVLIQGLRFVANEVDRIGWRLTGQTDNEDETENPHKLQKRLLVLIVFLIQAANIALVVQAYWITDLHWVIGLVALLIFIELLFAMVRRVNREISFDSPVYGSPEGLWLGMDSNRTTSDLEKRLEKLDERLDSLDELRQEGKISAEAYRRAVDEYRVAEAMKDS